MKFSTNIEIIPLQRYLTTTTNLRLLDNPMTPSNNRQSFTTKTPKIKPPHRSKAEALIKQEIFHRHLESITINIPDRLTAPKTTISCPIYKFSPRHQENQVEKATRHRHALAATPWPAIQGPRNAGNPAEQIS